MGSNVILDLGIRYFFNTRLKSCDKQFSKLAQWNHVRRISYWFSQFPWSFGNVRIHWSQIDPKNHLCMHLCSSRTCAPLGADTRRIFFIIEHQNSIIVVSFDQLKKCSKFKFGARKKLQIHFFLSQNCHKFLKIWSYISVTKLCFFGGNVKLRVHRRKVLNTFSSQNYAFLI